MDLGTWRKIIEGPSEDARFTAWMELYLSVPTDRDAQEEVQRLLTSKDPILKILFIRFLSMMNEERAVRYLQTLLCSDNPIVIEAAKRAFEKNQYQAKLKMLMPVLEAPTLVAKSFALKNLSFGGVVHVVDVCLEWLKTQQEVELLSAVLSAMRHLPDRRMLSALDPFLKDSREGIRLRSVFVLGSLYESGILTSVRPLWACLEDESPKVRRAVLWALRQRPSRKDLNLLRRLSLQDPDPLVRQESLIEMSLFPTLRVIDHFLAVLVSEEDRMVLLRAEGLLFGMNLDRLLKGLKRGLHKQEEKLRNKATILMAEFQRGSEGYYQFLTKKFSREKEDKKKLPFLEAFGILGNLKAVPLLEATLYQSTILSYASMTALLKILKSEKQPPFVKYLMDTRLPHLLKQMVLKQLIRRGETFFYEKDLVACLLQMVRDPTINIRYLAAQALSLVNHPDILSTMIESLTHEPDPVIRQFFEESLIRTFSKTPSLILDFVSGYQHDADRLHLLLEIMKKSPLSGPLLLSLLNKVPSEKMMEWIFSAVISDRISMEDFLSRLCLMEAKEEILKAFLATLQKQSKTFTLPTPFLEKWFQESSHSVQKMLIDLMAFSDDRSVVPLLSRLLCDDAFKPLQPRLLNVLQSLIIRVAA